LGQDKYLWAFVCYLLLLYLYSAAIGGRHSNESPACSNTQSLPAMLSRQFSGQLESILKRLLRVYFLCPWTVFGDFPDFLNLFNYETLNMENKKGMNFFFVIIAIISGIKLWKKFDCEILKFDDPLQSIIYIIYILGFVASIYGIIINYKNRPKK